MTDILGDFNITAEMVTAADDREVRLAVSELKGRAPELCMTAPGSTGEIIMTEAEFEGFVSLARHLFKQSGKARDAYANGVRGAGVEDYQRVTRIEAARIKLFRPQAAE